MKKSSLFRGMDAVLHGYRGVQTRHEGHIQAGGVDKQWKLHLRREIEEIPR
jgi:hypothetical protein